MSATFIGVHDFDHRLPDYSENGVTDLLAGMHALLERADTLPAEELSIGQQIDRQLAAGFLRLQCWEIESGRFLCANPSLYCGEAIFGVMSLFLAEFAPLAQRVEAATARLNAVPTLLRQAEQNIDSSPPQWAQQAMDECNGSLAFLGRDALRAAGEACTDAYCKAVNRAAKAFENFRVFLGRQIDMAHAPPSGCGAEALALHIKEAHCLDKDSSSIAEYAREEIQRAKATLSSRLGEFRADSPAAALQSLADIHPEAGDYYNRYQEIWNEVKALAVANELVSWPDFPVRYVPQPHWARRAAPSLYFLYYRSPAAFRRPPVHDYLVTPIDGDLPRDQQRERLRANNDSVIRLNHVVHHGGIGHHVQNWHAFRAKSRVGQIAAVDCASRIAMHCGGTMAEGWACYATDLVAEFGGLTPLEEYAETQSRIRMAARALVDIEFHEGRLGFEEAVDFYVSEAGMSAAAAHYEVCRNSMYPGMALMYLTGCDAIHELRHELSRHPHFSLREFHDRFLSYGSIPVALVADKMRVAQNSANNHNQRA